MTADQALGGAGVVGRGSRFPGVWFATGLVDRKKQTPRPTNEGLICTSSPIDAAPGFNELTRV